MLYLVLIVIALAAAFVRMAPSDPAKWHLPVAAQTDKDFDGGAARVITGDAARFEALDQAARALPRTQVLAGSVAEGRVTYVTRTKGAGFPDYTTIEIRDGTIALLARLRFGKKDFGVNRMRLEQLLAATQG